MDTTETFLLRLDEYAKANSISRRELADRLGVPYNTLKKWYYLTTPRTPSAGCLSKIKSFLEREQKPETKNRYEEATQRTEKIKYLLLLLEAELRWFRDSDSNTRAVFRQELNAEDIGYVSSLLTMITEEDKFKRWLSLTTAKFQSFGMRSKL